MRNSFAAATAQKSSGMAAVPTTAIIQSYLACQGLSDVTSKQKIYVWECSQTNDVTDMCPLLRLG